MIRRLSFLLIDFLVPAGRELFLGDKAQGRGTNNSKEGSESGTPGKGLAGPFSLKTRVTYGFSYRITVFLFNEAVVIFPLIPVKADLHRNPAFQKGAGRASP